VTQVTNLGVVGRGRSRITPTAVAENGTQIAGSSASKTDTLEEGAKRRTLEGLMAGDGTTVVGFDQPKRAKVAFAPPASHATEK
jgi:hypothetical protein